jgi:hypothetical protein
MGLRAIPETEIILDLLSCRTTIALSCQEDPAKASRH